ncbi:MAG: hypothetical protein ACJAV1_003793, partial [Paraglaciecola sp.]
STSTMAFLISNPDKDRSPRIAINSIGVPVTTSP